MLALTFVSGVFPTHALMRLEFGGAERRACVRDEFSDGSGLSQSLTSDETLRNKFEVGSGILVKWLVECLARQ
ncbi:hypothetical protein BDV95DRAFT_219719 [Massariosphaeria phaeospora]|uniref:Uncharacterized protein n=1 Tax=Massariosphaeria phaeospora TaxID=100035 RepID=A0A7C8ICI6_9PLEO|nr:hypothetical protein BDV95DRAFT_219719 [Massariosphaeria phaeospora]